MWTGRLMRMQRRMLTVKQRDLEWAMQTKNKHKESQKFFKESNKKHFDALTMFDSVVLEDPKSKANAMNAFMGEDARHVRTGLSYADVAFLD